MTRLPQLNLFLSSALPHGAFTPPARGNPKGARPFSKHVSLHVVLKSSRARGSFSLLRRERAVRAVLERQAARFGVQLQGVANVGNHLHLLLRAPSRERLVNFLRAVSGLVARLILGEGLKGPVAMSQVTMMPDETKDGHGDDTRDRGAPPERGSKRSDVIEPNAPTRFWDTRPFSRLVGNGRDWRGVSDYLALNRLEALGASRDIARAVIEREREERGSNRETLLARAGHASYT